MLCLWIFILNWVQRVYKVKYYTVYGTPSCIGFCIILNHFAIFSSIWMFAKSAISYYCLLFAEAIPKLSPKIFAKMRKKALSQQPTTLLSTLPTHIPPYSPTTPPPGWWWAAGSSHITQYIRYLCRCIGSQERLIVGWLPGTIYPPKHRCLYFLRHKGRQLAKHFSSLWGT